MTKKISLFFLLAALYLLPVCAEAQETNGLKLPLIPTELRTPEERASYLAAHYWDHFLFRDSLQYLNHPETVEQAVVDFIDLFRLVPSSEAETAITHVMQQASCTRNGLFFFYNTFEKYLYDLASPMRNEAYFIPVLEQMVASERLSAEDKIRPEMLLQSVRKNRVSSPATDFNYTLADGSQQSLYALKATWTLLLFFDPDCDECHQAIQEIQQNQFFQELIQQKKLTLLAVYPGDNLNHWKLMQPNLPAEWLVAYDKEQSIYTNELYDILGFPSLYLLDSQKIVRLKDTAPAQVEAYLKSANL